MTIEQQIADLKLVPVIKITDPAHAAPLAEALIAAGLPVAEVTFRTDCAAEAIKIMSQYKDLLLGAGTVINAAQVEEAKNAGATFIISPGFSPEVSKACIAAGLIYFPGIASPRDIQDALADGWKTLKFFPAEALGGVNTLKAFAAPYPGVKFVPTGGINADNVGEYLALPQVQACGGSWMVPNKLMDAGDFSGITKIAKEALNKIK
ncbi:bifunctional 4-hydroxy-2-oxoglutarate aldolase/2-dehydro-3-deoxy-phosphogluconate aldolase [Lentisphaera profundi]|uniref:2-dehydro-3-deoxy-phosphogluconate aldolase n=1 Tax=Lentisphaera profundi TaxID=1658616 RepID=A0ABY7VRU9_9BACT|nr:bifunctional 4-hydroxy-2-oxoglutarate aldolase/2-dehydro-3-deoxy-phosphogluconate aldolase [Lentisphaera profundi]WDE96935.1 bifunctional 4-hydroxy-2-oxoglutarate aldolase/2-dehydro-3-deoxy-phosphogluconate aldolase [Lentisphaera profundi]